MLRGDEGSYRVLTVTTDLEDEDPSSILFESPEAKSTLVIYSPQREEYLQQLQTLIQLLLQIKEHSNIRLVGFFQIETGSIVCQLFANNCNDEEVKRKLEAELRKLEYIPSIYSQDYFEDKSLSEFYASLPSIVPGSQAVSADTFSDFFFQIQGDRIYTFGDPELLSYLSYNANYPNVSYGKSSVSPEIVARAEEQKRYTGILHEFISVLLKLNAPANVKKLNQAHIQYCKNVSRTLGGDRMFFFEVYNS